MQLTSHQFQIRQVEIQNTIIGFLKKKQRRVRLWHILGHCEKHGYDNLETLEEVENLTQMGCIRKTGLFMKYYKFIASPFFNYELH